MRGGGEKRGVVGINGGGISEGEGGGRGIYDGGINEEGAEGDVMGIGKRREINDKQEEWENKEKKG